MGLTWILALIANWQQAAFLQYPSNLLNSMQGAHTSLLMGSEAFPIIIDSYRSRYIIGERQEKKRFSHLSSHSGRHSVSIFQIFFIIVPFFLLRLESHQVKRGLTNKKQFHSFFIGFFIMLCFTTTKKVRGFLKEKVRKRCNRIQPQTSMTQCTGSAGTKIATGSTTFSTTTQLKSGDHTTQNTS